VLFSYFQHVSLRCIECLHTIKTTIRIKEKKRNSNHETDEQTRNIYGEIIILRVIINELLNVVFKYGFICTPNTSKKNRLGKIPTPANDWQSTKRLFAENFRALEQMSSSLCCYFQKRFTPAKPSRCVTTQPNSQSTSYR